MPTPQASTFLLAAGGGSVPQPSDVKALFHRLNNQLGVILANAELLETKAADEAVRARAGQVVSGALDAMTTARLLRALVDELTERESS